MKSILRGLVVTSAVMVCSPAAAADRCSLTTSGAEVLVRYPIAHFVGQQITKHTNKHIIWTIVGTQATPGSVLGDEDPAIIAVGTFEAVNVCQALWQERDLDGNFTVKLAKTAGFVQVDSSAFHDGTERPALPWDVVSSFDLTGEGGADLLWWSPQGPTASLWTWDGANRVWITSPVNDTAPHGWRPVAAARLETGGARGIIWYNPAASPTLSYHRVWAGGQGVAVQSVADMAGLDQAGWTIVALGDYDGDGKEDLLRQNDLTRRLQVCFMNGLSLREECSALNPDGFEQPQEEEWFVVGPR